MSRRHLLWPVELLPRPSYAVPVADVGTADAVVGLSRGLRLHPAMKGAIGSDMPRLTWADDGNLYGTWGDGNGFAGGTYVSYGIFKLVGGPEGYTPTDTYYGPAGSGHGKLYGITSINGVLYMWKSADDWSSYTLYKSTDHGASIVQAGTVTFVNTSTGLSALQPILMGQDQDDAIDSYTYFIASPPDEKGPVYLVRVPTASIETQASYEVFSGTPSSPAWSSSFANKATILSGTDHSHASVHYLPGLGCFLLKSGGPFGTSQDASLTFEPMRFWTGPHPWGPWTQVAESKQPHPDLYGASPEVSCDIAPKWSSADGSTLWLTFSGLAGWDSFNACELGLRTGPVSADWLDQDGGALDLFRSIAKGDAVDDSKYLASPSNPTGQPVTVQLGPIEGTPTAVQTVLRLKWVAP